MDGLLGGGVLPDGEKSLDLFAFLPDDDDTPDTLPAERLRLVPLV